MFELSLHKKWNEANHLKKFINSHLSILCLLLFEKHTFLGNVAGLLSKIGRKCGIFFTIYIKPWRDTIKNEKLVVFRGFLTQIPLPIWKSTDITLRKSVSFIFFVIQFSFGGFHIFLLAYTIFCWHSSIIIVFNFFVCILYCIRFQHIWLKIDAPK